jgi:hypothetical protein
MLQQVSLGPIRFIFSVDSTLIQIVMDRNAGFKPVISATITSVDSKYINF